MPFDVPQQQRTAACESARSVPDPPARQRYDKPGNVVFLKSDAALRPLVAVAKRLAPPSKGRECPKIVTVEPLLASGPTEDHPLTRLRSLKDRLPGLLAEHAVTRSESLRAIIVLCVRKQHERSGGKQTELQECEMLMPGRGGELQALMKAESERESASPSLCLGG